MKKGNIYEGYVERMDFPNKGVVRVETEEGTEYAHVKDALPGRRISFMVIGSCTMPIRSRRSTFLRAICLR